MEPTLLAGALIAGYLAGSVPFAAVIGRIVAPGRDLRAVSVRFGEGGGEVRSGGISATNARLVLGARWGFLAGTLDIAKAALVTAAFTALAPGTEAGVVAGAAAVVGHVFPVWLRFRGGYGVSPILGTFLVFDPVALVAALLLAGIVGTVIADRLVAYDAWLFVLVPVLTLRDAPVAAAAALAVGLLYWWAMRAEVREHLARIRAGGRPWRVRFAEIAAGYTGSRVDDPERGRGTLPN